MREDLVFIVISIIIVAAVSFVAGQLREASNKKPLRQDWAWLAMEYADVAVKAAYSMFTNAIEERYPFAEAWVLDSLMAEGIQLSESDKQRLRAIIESAWADFKVKTQAATK